MTSLFIAAATATKLTSLTKIVEAAQWRVLRKRFLNHHLGLCRSQYVFFRKNVTSAEVSVVEVRATRTARRAVRMTRL